MDSHEQQQKDFMSSFFPIDMPLDADHNASDGQAGIFQFDMSNGFNQQPPQSSSAMDHSNNMDFMNNIMSMQSSSANSPIVGPTQAGPYNPQLLLEQQFKVAQLQQLQQLQSQIFQQQIAIISGKGRPGVDALPVEPPRDATFHSLGLPTPGPSAELRAQQHPMEFVSPMILDYMDNSRESYRDSTGLNNNNHFGNQYRHHRGSTSAPADIAFDIHSSPAPGHTLHSPTDLDVSPLTSPWLGAESNPQIHPSFNPHSNNSNNNKRVASPAEDESARKRHSPAIRPTNPNAGPSRRASRPSRSTGSTPLLRSTRSRKGSVGSALGEASTDSPSPVDLSSLYMPPPSTLPYSAESSSQPSPATSHLKPVTPAMMMNIGSRHTVKGHDQPSPDLQPSSRQQPLVREQPTKVKNSNTKSKAAASVSSPGLKPILPASGVTSTSTMSAPTPSKAQPGGPIRKTSHKAAEQKRRDSLKTTFDDLRGLLPPIPLSSDPNADEVTMSLLPVKPTLPGSLPPRGPPKAGGEGPNKGVSKLQLLMCGNEFIRVLKGRVERRDEEIRKLRREVIRLRNVNSVLTSQVPEMEMAQGDHDGMGQDLQNEGEEDIDLEKDLDAVELLIAGLARGANISVLGDLDEDGDEDGDG